MKRWIGIIAGLSSLASYPGAAQDVPIGNREPRPLHPLVQSDPPAPSQPRSLPSVEALSDVQPTDWAYQAVQNLIERYALNLGYADGTFRGDRVLTRYEFAAGLAAALSALEGIAVSQDDLIAIQRLVELFGPDLEEIRDRLSDLEARTTVLEGYWFSPTVQLRGQVMTALTDGSGAQPTLIGRIRFGLQASFQGDDLLVTELEMGNEGWDAIGLAQSEGINLLGTDGVLADGGGLEFVNAPETVQLRRFYYTWQPLPDLVIAVGPKLIPRDWIDRSSYADDSGTNFNTSFFQNNPLIIQNPVDRIGGAGAAVVWSPEGDWTLRSLYVAADATDPTEGGLFEDPYQGSVELEYRLNPDLLLRLQYTHAEVNEMTVDAGGLYGEWAVHSRLAIFGRYGIAHYNGQNTVLQEDLDLEPHTWMIGAAFSNIVIPGSNAGVAIGQPFVEDDLGEASQWNAEAFYNLWLSDRLSITPSLSIVANPDNDDRATVWQGSLRTLFLF